jgi:hypothetical protein
MCVGTGRQSIIILFWKKEFHFWEYIKGNQTFILNSHRPFICSAAAGILKCRWLNSSWPGILLPLEVRKGFPRSEAKFLDEIQTKVWTSFPPCYSRSPLYSLPWDFYFFKLTQPLTVSTVQFLYTEKEKGGKPDRKPYLLPYSLKIHTETSSLRTIKILPRNLNKIVCSWIRLLECKHSRTLHGLSPIVQDSPLLF